MAWIPRLSASPAEGLNSFALFCPTKTDAQKIVGGFQRLCRYHYGGVTTSNNAYALWCLMWYDCLNNVGAGYINTVWCLPAKSCACLACLAYQNEHADWDWFIGADRSLWVRQMEWHNFIWNVNKSAGQITGLHSSISASFRFTRQSIHCIGQAALRVGQFARLTSKPAGEQTGQNISTKQLFFHRLY